MLSWVPLVLYFMGSLAATSVIGLACYKAVQWLEDKLPEVLGGLEVIFVLLAICVIIASLSTDLMGISGAGIVGMICAVGTCAERAIPPTQQGWGFTFLRMLFTTACCVVLSLVLVFVALDILSRSLSLASETCIEVGSVMGAFCSPSVIPIFMWVWRSSQLRPGVDRHLEKEEHNHVF